MNKLDNANSELLELVSDYTDLTIKYSNCVNSKQFNDFDQNETIDFKTELGE